MTRADMYSTLSKWIIYCMQGYESTLTSAEPAMSADDLLSPDPLHSKSLQGRKTLHLTPCL